MRYVFLALLLLGFAGTAPAQAAPNNAQVVEVTPINDPIEPFNRAVFQFNRYTDMLILKPVTTVYDFILPRFVRNGIHNFLVNLGAPVAMLNSLLQGDFANFELTLHRFVVNSTLGMGGFNDVATSLKMPMHVRSDFGQTMGHYGAGHGFYLVLPIIGSSSGRDGAGRVVDFFTDPFNMVMMDSETEWPMYVRAGLTAIDTRSRNGKAYEDVLDSAVDPYVTFRSLYVQQRAYMVQNRASDSYGDAEAATR
jgi:phospholipid-binding lipoprotein MlaA